MKRSKPPAKVKPNLDRPLTAQILKFVEAYARLGVGRTAAVEAGYAPANADAQASRLLTNPKVRQAVANLSAKAAEKGVKDATERRQFWSAVMDNEEVPWPARLKASELLGKTAGDFIDRVEHTTPQVTMNLNLAGSPGG
jgi:phage terminase small subunit